MDGERYKLGGGNGETSNLLKWRLGESAAGMVNTGEGWMLVQAVAASLVHHLPS